MSFVDNESDRPMRSVLVGNIPIEVSEEHLKELFSEFGMVLNIRFFKANSSIYTLCEYGNQEMALLAIRNLNNIEMKGRIVTADIAGSEKSKVELQALQDTLNFTGELLAEATSEKAPEEISKAVASLPAEQMFELMKQMKMCIENNPQEARNLLLQNPQLAYALLQAQVIMRIVDPQVAMKILDRVSAPQTVADEEVKQESIEMMDLSSTGDQDLRQLPPVDQDFRILPPPAVAQDKDMRQMAGDTDLRTLGPPMMMPDNRMFDPRFHSAAPRIDPRMAPGAMLGPTNPTPMPLIDPRAMSVPDPRMASIDPRMLQNSDPRAAPGVDPRLMGLDPRSIPVTDPGGMPVSDPRGMHGIDPRSVAGGDPRQMPRPDMGMSGPGPAFGPRPVDPRSVQVGVPRMEDPRKAQAAPGVSISARMPANIRTPISVAAQNISGISSAGLRAPFLSNPGGKLPEDEEKAALIMQVLQLSEEQIALLPAEQRQSIIVLKDQIARSQFTL